MKRGGFGLLFLFLARKGLEQFNANVRWTFACRRLDGDVSLRFALGKSAPSPVAVPDKIFGLTHSLDFIDRCHSLPSLTPPPAAVGSLPLPVYAQLRCANRYMYRSRTRLRCLYLIRPPAVASLLILPVCCQNEVMI